MGELSNWLARKIVDLVPLDIGGSNPSSPICRVLEMLLTFKLVGSSPTFPTRMNYGEVA